MSWISRTWSNTSRKTIVVGITSRSHKDNFQWLVEFIMKKYSDLLEVRHLPITNNNRRDWEEAVRTCSAVILYHTKHQGRVNVTDVDGSLYDDELRYLNHCLGREKVLVVLDDMNDISDNERQRILKAQRSLKSLSSHLILIPERNKVEAATRKLEELFLDLSEGVRRSPMEEERSEHKPHSSMTSEPTGWFKNAVSIGTKKVGKYFTTNSTASSSSAPSKPKPPHPTYRVGIFSRAAESNYSWLVDSLKADGCLRSADIKAFYISNHYPTFRSGLQQCHFAILYHTKKQGRLNITDVTDSLYDKELQEMSEFLGKENVIVVVDDVESSGSEEKDRILNSQLSIRKCARDLFLFTETEKQTKNLEEIRGIIQRRLPIITAQRSVPVTAHPTAPHSDGESSRRDLISFVDSPENRTTQGQEATPNDLPSCSESVSLQTAFHENDNREPESKRPKTSSPSETTNSMEVTGDLSQPSSFDFLYAIRMKWNKSQQEIEELTQEKLSQEETIEELRKTIMTLTTERDTMKRSREEKERRTQNIEESQKEEEKRMIPKREGSGDWKEEMREDGKTSPEGKNKVQGEEIGMKTSFQEREERPHKHRTQPQEEERLPEAEQYMKEHLQIPAGSSSLENLTMGELITGLQEIINEKDLKIQRQGEKIRRQENEIQRQREKIQRQEEEIQRLGEKIRRQGDEIQRQEEEIQRLGEKIQRQGDEIQRQREKIQRQKEEIQRQGDEILNYDYICREQKCELERKVQQI